MRNTDMISASPMRTWYFLGALLAALLFALGVAPAAILAQSDDDDEGGVGVGLSASASVDADSASADADAEADDKYGDSEPSVDDEDEDEEEEDLEEDEENATAIGDSTAVSGAISAQDAVDEAGETSHGVFSGKLSIAIFGGYGLHLAGDKTINPFGVGETPKPESVNYGAVDPTMMVMPPPPTVFDRGRAVMEGYNQRQLGLEPKPNPFGTAFGARVGYTLPNDPLYIGVLFNYFSGNKLTVPANNIPAMGASPAVINPTIVSTSSVILVGVEGGLDWDLGEHLVLRPALGVGAGLASAKLCLQGEQVVIDPVNKVTMSQDSCQSVSSTRLYLMPGLSAIVPIDMFFVAAEGRFVGLSGDGGQASFYLGGNAGIALEL